MFFTIAATRSAEDFWSWRNVFHMFLYKIKDFFAAILYFFIQPMWSTDFLYKDVRFFHKMYFILNIFLLSTKAFAGDLLTRFFHRFLHSLLYTIVSFRFFTFFSNFRRFFFLTYGNNSRYYLLFLYFPFDFGFWISIFVTFLFTLVNCLATHVHM